MVSELCYRYVETPIRNGAAGRIVARLRREGLRSPTSRRLTPSGVVLGSSLVLLVVLIASYVTLAPFDRAAGGADTGFVLAAPPVTAGGGAGAPGAAAPAPLPRRIVLVGDSTAHALAINLPGGIGSTFRVADGSIDGCSIFDSGTVHSSVGYDRQLTCPGWSDRWRRSAASSKALLAVVVLGAWDVLDITLGATTYVVGSPQHDALFTAHLQSGIDALAASGAHVVLLEIPCMRPQQAKGEGTPPLPERADDQRVAHLNALMQQVAASEPDIATFVHGPAEWCTDPTIATSLAYRWDGVHVYKPGAKLIYETIAPALLAIPIPG